MKNINIKEGKGIMTNIKELEDIRGRLIQDNVEVVSKLRELIEDLSYNLNHIKEVEVVLSYVKSIVEDKHKQIKEFSDKNLPSFVEGDRLNNLNKINQVIKTATTNISLCINFLELSVKNINYIGNEDKLKEYSKVISDKISYIETLDKDKLESIIV